RRAGARRLRRDDHGRARRVPGQARGGRERGRCTRAGEARGGAEIRQGTDMSEELTKAVAHLRAGGVVAVATDTFFGLCADARRASAVEAVFALKGREETKASALLLPSEELWDTLVTEVPPLGRRLAARFWAGPLSI